MSVGIVMIVGNEGGTGATGASVSTSPPPEIPGSSGTEVLENTKNAAAPPANRNSTTAIGAIAIHGRNPEPDGPEG